MRKPTKVTFAALALGVGLVAGPALYAQTTQAPSAAPTERGGSHMDRGMMSDDMMGMMAQMRQMMDACNKMMASKQDQSPTPAEPRPKE
jgi:hypothetical protein